jgi:branched-chain amino acid transport system ATP-binding protein
MREQSDTEGKIDTLLRLEDVEAVYDDSIIALRGVTFDMAKGTIAALLGANGAGKTTTLKAISNLLNAENGRVRRGSITWEGRTVTAVRPSRLVEQGLVQVLEGRQCFLHLTVEENLLAGGFVRRLSRRQLQTELERVYQWFPRLQLRRRSLAGLLSGGEQQMVAIGRALMTKPNLVLLDEPSMGLAPMLVEEIFEIVRNLNRQEGISFLVAEQNVGFALRYADHAFVLENGQIRAQGRPDELAHRADLAAIYLGGDMATA